MSTLTIATSRLAPAARSIASQADRAQRLTDAGWGTFRRAVVIRLIVTPWALIVPRTSRDYRTATKRHYEVASRCTIPLRDLEYIRVTHIHFPDCRPMDPYLHVREDYLLLGIIKRLSQLAGGHQSPDSVGVVGLAQEYFSFR